MCIYESSWLFSFAFAFGILLVAGCGLLFDLLVEIFKVGVQLIPK